MFARSVFTTAEGLTGRAGRRGGGKLYARRCGLACLPMRQGKAPALRASMACLAVPLGMVADAVQASTMAALSGLHHAGQWACRALPRSRPWRRCSASVHHGRAVRPASCGPVGMPGLASITAMAPVQCKRPPCARCQACIMRASGHAGPRLNYGHGVRCMRCPPWAWCDRQATALTWCLCNASVHLRDALARVRCRAWCHFAKAARCGAGATACLALVNGGRCGGGVNNGHCAILKFNKIGFLNRVVWCRFF